MKIREKPMQKTFKINSVRQPKTKLRKKTTSKPVKLKAGLSKISVDDFMAGGFDDINDETNSDFESSMRSTSSKMNGKIKVKKQKQSKRKDLDDSVSGIKAKRKDDKTKVKNKKKTSLVKEGEANGGDETSEESGNEEMIEKHKRHLDGLKTSDPEFYKYLKDHDEDLLNFEESESDLGKDDEEEACHTAPDKLEVASDESDFEPEEGGLPLKKSGRAITMAMVSSWQERLPTTKNKKLLTDVVDAFHASVLRVSVGDDDAFRFKVDGSPVFNAVIRMCVVDLNSGLRSFLKLEDSNTPPNQSKLWVKVRSLLKVYLEDLTQLAGVTSPSMLTVLLKHIHQMVPFLVFFPNIAQRTLRRLIVLWSTSEEVVRVLAFLCLLRLSNKRHSFLNSILKKMYLTYVKNTKFVSPTTLPEINFMRQSLSEMFALDAMISYQMAFVYIRQLAVHLRNAITLKKKEHFQAVYNWQYISSLQLWGELFGLVPNGSPLRTLVYPLIQIIIGTIKLIPSSQYYPLRFHCCRILINVSGKCEVFVPVLPFLLEVLQEFDFNREHKKLSMKPMDLTCVLRCTKLQMKENAFKDALMENMNNLLIEYIATESHRISFPDVFVPAVLQLKQFVKGCKVVNYVKMMKAILDKINENSKFIESERNKVNFKLSDTKTVEAIEAGIKVKGTPFLTYHESWKKIYRQQQARKVIDQVKVGDHKLPVIYKMDKKRSRQQSRSVGPPELFPSDEEGSDISIGRVVASDSDEDKGKKRKKKRKVEKTDSGKASGTKKPRSKLKQEMEVDGGDIVEDFQLSDDE